VQSLKEAAVTFLKRSKPILLAAESTPSVEAAPTESSGKRKRADESEDTQVKENPEDERNRRRVRKHSWLLAILLTTIDR
jgi:hypothetical protein